MATTNPLTKLDLEGQSGVAGKVTVTFQENVAIIHMLCGENRLNVDFVTKLNSALDKVERNSNAEVLITISDGKIYSNGLDLDWMTKFFSNPSKRDYFIANYVMYVFKRLTTFPLPTVAALNGHAFAGGFMLALCHDYIVMSSTRGWVCLNEVHLGMPFAPFMKKLIQAKLPTGIAMNEAMVLGKRFTAEEGHEKGIVQKICPREELFDCAKSLGKSLVSRGAYNRSSLQNMKDDIYGWCFKVTPSSNL